MGVELFNKYFSFAFVRNPWDWVRSNYTYAKKNPRHKKHRLVNNLGSFSEYCRWHCNEDQNIKFQKDYIFENNQQVLSFVGRQETLDSDFRVICNKIGIKNNLPHYNKSDASESLDKYYNQYLYDLVSSRFSEDVNLLGYSNYLDNINTGCIQ